jgi:3D (Asp-Asp-Asp) domain-containing protein
MMALLISTIIIAPFKPQYILASEANAMVVTVVDGGSATERFADAGTVGEFFTENGIELNAKDQVSHGLEEPVTDGMTISIQRGLNIVVSIDGNKEKRRVSGGVTVERLMLALQTEWNTALIYDGDPTRPLADGETVAFTSWQNAIFDVTEPIAYETFEFETTGVSQGQTKVRQQGVQGEKKLTMAVISVGGQERQREVLHEEVLLEPVPEIIDIGIGGSLGTTTDTSSPSFHYIDKMTLNASAYTSGYESTSKNPGDPGYGITRSGEPVRRGIVSVDPRVIPLGTKLYVTGYGYSLAADTGSGIVGHMIDLYYESYEEAIQFGRRNLEVYILE